MSLRFTQSCPTCGRRVEIRAALLGCTVACQHCRGEFIASEVSDSGGLTEPSEAPAPTSELMMRAEELLQQVDQRAALP